MWRCLQLLLLVLTSWVEHSGSLGFYVDSLVRSIRHPLQTAEFVHEHVVKPIRSFCASQEGCMGGFLEENVLRHECVKHLSIRRYRRNQSVPTVDLMSRVEGAKPEYYIQTWSGVAADGMPNVCVLETRIEFATSVQGRVILGSEDDVNWASSSYVPQVLEDCYPDTNIKCGKRRGVAVLISMEKYKNKPRRGESVDRDKLVKLAESLKLDMVKFEDASTGKLEIDLGNIARTGIREDDECFVCSVNGRASTFDGAFHLMCTDDKWISLKDSIVTPFGKCENLKGKPKIFFVNACRGNVKLRGMSETVVDALDETGIGDQPHFGSWEDADHLTVFSTTQGAASIRSVEYGSNFVESLVRNVNEKRDSRDLLNIVRLMICDVVSIEVDYTDPSSNKAMKISQCPEVHQTLTKSIYWRSA